jgi:hypothetical protein
MQKCKRRARKYVLPDANFTIKNVHTSGVLINTGWGVIAKSPNELDI